MPVTPKNVAAKPYVVAGMPPMIGEPSPTKTRLMADVDIINERLRGLAPVAEGKLTSLAERFLIPPFSVLDARQGYWQTRKRAWLSLGIESELGRGDDGKAQTFGSGKPGDLAAGFKSTNKFAPGGTSNSKKNAWLHRTNEGIKSLGEMDSEGIEYTQSSGTSIFDPVLCELIYRWFSPAKGLVLDPFAGGSVRGIVAALLGRKYFGVDLRQEQVLANRKQAEQLAPSDNQPTWFTGDSIGIRRIFEVQPSDEPYDLMFSCPPYAYLERYSDDPRDLSTMTYTEFLKAYDTIIGESCTLLKPDSFACFIVGDIRDTVGNYQGFVQDTISCFMRAGLTLYNQAVLVTSVGSLPIRVGRQFAGMRKLGNTHQHVLVFLKGDARQACERLGKVDVDDFDMPELERDSIALCYEDLNADACKGLDILPGNGVLTLKRQGVAAVTVNDLYLTAAFADIIRSRHRAKCLTEPRTWVSDGERWNELKPGQTLTIINGCSELFLNPEVFNTPANDIEQLAPDAGVFDIGEGM